jgi:FtsP/CotA-like multicopper oxidase with cupredoxin domain
MGPAPDPADYITGQPIAPEPWEAGWKETVIANPGEITRIISKFDIAGLYVWHCHILEHEDNEMMRPYIVRPMEVQMPLMFRQ